MSTLALIAQLNRTFRRADRFELAYCRLLGAERRRQASPEMGAPLCRQWAGLDRWIARIYVEHTAFIPGDRVEAMEPLRAMRDDMCFPLHCTPHDEESCCREWISPFGSRLNAPSPSIDAFFAWIDEIDAKHAHLWGHGS